MNAIVIWLLVSIGTPDAPTAIVERFKTAAECQRVAKAVNTYALTFNPANLICVQAEVIRP